MQRRLILGGLLAALIIGSLGAVQPVSADTTTVTGVGNVTAYANCPNAFKIPLEGVNVAGNTWKFTIVGFHLGCVVAWGQPTTFEGLWNPLTGSSSFTGSGCPQSTDPQRPGFLCLGPVPGQLTLYMVDLRFCVNSKCFEGYAFVERV